MKRQDFISSPSGTLIATERSQYAFVPNSLPPRLDMAPVATQLADTARLLGELDGIGRTLPDAMLLIRPLQAREALASSSMEGTYSTVDELMFLEAGGSPPLHGGDAVEVYNYRRALTEAIGSLETIPLSLRTLRSAHATLLAHVRQHRGAAVPPGEFKAHQNFIGGRADGIETARFIPPPPAETLICLDQLEKYIHRERRGDIPDLIDAALIHYQFETIHPFADGNGRVGRMLITLHLIARGVIRQPILYPSPVFERRKDAYIERMYNVSRVGDWTAWVNFFLRVLADAAAEAISTADALLALQKEYRGRLHAAGRSAVLQRVVDFLFLNPVLTIPQIAAFAGVTYRSAQLNVEKLVSVQILREVEGTGNPRYFAAPEILDIVRRQYA